MVTDDRRLAEPALCLEWAVPVGGLASLSAPAERGVGGRMRRLLREAGGWAGESVTTEAYAEAERLAGSIARIACPGLRVVWSTTGARDPGEIHLDSRMLAPRRGWDLPHRVDALMGLTLRDAAHALRTPSTFRHDLADLASHADLFGNLQPGEAPEQAMAALLALFLLVEMRHTTCWLTGELPGFRGYGQTLWTWLIPAAEAERRLGGLRNRPTFGALLEGLVTLLAGRAFLSDVPASLRPLIDTVLTALRSIDGSSSPEQRYALAVALYRMLRDLFDPQKEDVRQRGDDSPTGTNEPPALPTVEPPVERPELADEDLEGRQAALEAMAAIAGSALDPEEEREGLPPQQAREVESRNARAGGRRSSGPGEPPDEQEDTFVSHRHLRLPGARPMKVIVPPISPDVEVRYRGSYDLVRGQANALRQVLKFRLAERRHAIRGRYSGQLDEQALYRLAGGDDGVFLRRSIESAPDQDLCILLDESASMRAGQRPARATAVLFHHALHNLPGVRHWIFGFSGYGSAIALYRYISPDRMDLQQPQRLGAIRSREATPLGEAVAGAAEAMLSEGRGTQKLMIVVTDGQPDDIEGARHALRAAESRGVTILALGIAADAMATRDLFSHFTFYEDVASLPRKVGAILRRVVGTTS